MALSYQAPNNSPMVDKDGYVTPLWAAFFDSFLADTVAGSTPSGTVVMFDGSAEPAGWLFCDGRELSRRLYADLFASIGTRFGAGNGLTTFNIPDRRGKYLRGNLTIGTNTEGGTTDYVIAVANLPSGITVDITDPGHTHVFNGSASVVNITDPGHAHAQGATLAGNTTGVVGASPTYSSTNTASAVTGISATVVPLGTNVNATTGITASISDATDTPLVIEPPYFTTSFLIRA